jgi:uncharacterized damage-inducible protein DinB
MNSASTIRSWEHFRMAVGIGLRAVAAIPEAALDTHPIPNMRTPKEVAVHLFSGLHEFPRAVRDGKVGDYDEAATVAGIKTKADLLAFCHRTWTEGNAIVPTLTDAQIGGMVQTPWGGPMPGFVMMQITNDEFWHHRGQLYTYLRALGVEPVMLYDYENNDAAFQPKAAAKA